METNKRMPAGPKFGFKGGEMRECLAERWEDRGNNVGTSLPRNS